MSKKKVYTGEERKAQMLEAGAKLAAKHGAVNVTRKMVAEACKCAEGLVSNYMGDSPTAQRAYRRKMKVLGLSEPDKAKIEAIGVKLRAHGPRDKRDTRKRSAKEVEAIKRKTAKAAPAKSLTLPLPVARKPATRTTRVIGGVKVTTTERERKPATPRERKPKAAPALSLPSPAQPPRKAPERKASAARKPKAPPLPAEATA